MPHRSSMTRRAGILMAFASAIHGGGAHAQSAPPPPTEPVASLEEVVVTAEKRSANLQNVPIAVTALTANDLVVAGIQDSAELSQVVPGFSFNNQLGFGLPRIRGVGIAGGGPGIENPVATYIDGVYYGTAIAALFQLNDVDQVAVLKGPQGTLFGRNATGGLVQVTTRDPSQQFSGEVSGTVGSLDTYGGEVYITGPLTNTLSGSADYYMNDQQEGWGKNLVTNLWVQTHEIAATREKLMFQPDDATKVVLSADYEEVRAAEWAGRNLGYVLGSDASTPGGPWDTDTAVQPSLLTRGAGVSLNAQHDFGSVKLVNIAAYRNSFMNVYFDGSSVPFSGPGNTIINMSDDEAQFSEELDLQSTGSGPFVWSTGLYFLHSEGYFQPLSTQIAVAPGVDILITNTANEGLKSYAGFGQATYTFAQTNDLTVGLRYTEDQRTDAATQTSPFGFESVDTGKDFSKLTWRFALDHHFTPDVLGYISDNRGFKSGTYDPQTLPAVVLKPETLDAYEIGIKSAWLDDRLRLNAAAYYYDYTNVQVTAFVGTLEEVYNGNGATSYGLDLDLAAKPIPELTITGGVGWIHARYGSFYPAFMSVPNGPGIGGNTVTLTGNATGNQLQNTPPYTFDLGGVYEIPSSVGTFSVAANYYYNDGWFSEPENRLRQGAYSLVNASANWDSLNKRYGVRLWGKNLGNTIYAAQLSASGSGDDREAAPGRTYGITGVVHF
jgi:iron complex outermembrane recepter protein